MASLNNQLSDISKKTDLLVDMSGQIIDELGKVKGITKSFSKDLQQNWVSKNKVWVIAIISIAVLGIIGLLYSKFTAPFQMNVGVVVDNSIDIHPEYPKLSDEARIRFYFPEETKEKEVTFSNEIILSKISNKLKDSRCKAELLDSYWALSKDSIEINKGFSSLSIRPNEALAAINGRVQSRDGQTLLSNAIVKVDNIQSTTDEYGKFSLEVPIPLRRMKYIVRIEKEGYSTSEVEYIAGSDIEIRLIKE